jgi:hypothetical protein
MKIIYFNEDNEHFYAGHPSSDMSEDGVRRLVDTYAETGTIKGLLFCVNLQRALYDSDVWERFSDIKDDGPYVQNLRLLSRRGVDQFAIWLERSKQLGIENWLTMRMNDSHGLKEADQEMVDCSHYKWPSQKWRNGRHLRRAPYRSERSWEGSYNYGLPEIREHHLALIKELFERYDMFGLELDWMRWGMMFAPGFEREGQRVLTEFVGRVRELADAAETRYGHPIKLAHRVPSHPESCLNYGFNVIEWGERGWVDMLTVSSFLGGNEFDPQIALWRKLLPKDTLLNAYVSTFGATYPGNTVISDDFLRGAAAGALSCGADSLYLFNECYREPKNTHVLNELMRDIADPERLVRAPRRLTTGYTQAILAGESNRNTLPVPLIQKAIGYDMGRMEATITCRLNAGRIAPGTTCTLTLGFCADTDPEQMKGLPVRINTHLLPEGEWKALSQDRVDSQQPFQLFEDYPRAAALIYTCDVPADLLHETFNAVELLPPQIPGSFVWADLTLARV